MKSNFLNYLIIPGSFTSDVFPQFFFFLLFHCRLNTLYIIQLQFHYNLVNKIFCVDF